MNNNTSILESSGENVCSTDVFGRETMYLLNATAETCFTRNLVHCHFCKNTDSDDHNT